MFRERFSNEAMLEEYERETDKHGRGCAEGKERVPLANSLYTDARPPESNICGKMKKRNTKQGSSDLLVPSIFQLYLLLFI